MAFQYKKNEAVGVNRREFVIGLWRRDAGVVYYGVAVRAYNQKFMHVH